MTTDEDKRIGQIEGETAKLHALDRQRRTLTESLSDSEADLQHQQQRIAELARGLGDAGNDEIEREIAGARQRLKQLVSRRDTAAAALEQFQRRHPTEAQVQEQEDKLRCEQTQLEQRKVVNAVRVKVRELVGHLLHAETLCAGLSLAYREALRQWPTQGPADCQRAAGLPGMLGDLLQFAGTESHLFRVLETIGHWDFELLPEGHPARAAASAQQHKTQ
jgi:hypothetical protein